VKELMTEADFNKNYNIEFTDNFSFNYIGLNMRPDGVLRKKFFDDVRVRRAMAYVVPVDEIIQAITFGYAKRQASIVSPLKDEYNKDLTLIPLDIEAAKKLLDEAGWKDTDGDNVRDKVIDGVKTDLRIEFKHQAGQKFVEDVARMIKESAYKAGIDLIVVPVDGITLKEQLGKHDFDMYMSALAGGSQAEDYTQLWHTSAYTSGGSNYCGFGSAETDALLDSIKYTVDPVARRPLMMRLQQEIYDQQPYIFLYSAARKNIIHKRFGNQIMTFDRPGVILNNLRLLSLYGPQGGSTLKDDTMH
ncbi:MAG TPA: ABC transporter substrate-binding protein, partial [Chitinophagales bacterium]|nr:ABC transporter substrate-binding protein [Chitinophagales bacterium]